MHNIMGLMEANVLLREINEAVMEKFIEYVSTSAGRTRIVQTLQAVAIVCSSVLIIIMLLATYLRQ